MTNFWQNWQAKRKDTLSVSGIKQGITIDSADIKGIIYKYDKLDEIDKKSHKLQLT